MYDIHLAIYMLLYVYVAYPGRMPIEAASK
jgi:hypothetical protein